MKSLLRLVLVGIAIALTGCAATGPRYAEVESSFPTLSAGLGRLLVFRAGGIGGAVQPDIRLNGDVVGKSQPEGFFFVDRPAGRYKVSARTEVEATLDVDLTDGATTYVQTSITMGLFVGQPRLTLLSDQQATQLLPGLAYTGAIPVVAGGPRAPAAGIAPDRPPQSHTRATGPVTLDDLQGLLPPAR